MSEPTKDGGPAFPVTKDNANVDDDDGLGMSLLDYFAAAALTGLRWELYTVLSAKEYAETREKVAKECYTLAEAMLAERERRAKE